MISMKAYELIDFAAIKLKQKNILSYKLDSEILLSKALGKKREDILINLDQKVNFIQSLKFNHLIMRRASREPIAYIIKEKEFWSKVFIINKHALIPRPETELMVDRIIKIYKYQKISILDIGTGSGCILISLLSELINSRGVGIDISKEAIFLAKKNAKKHNIRNINFKVRSFTDIYNYKFDLIVSNPPYIQSKEIKNLQEDIKKYEPKIALDGGNDGLDVIKKVIYKAKDILKINGRLALEIGNEQHKKVSELLNKNNFKIEQNIKDYKTNIRCLIATLIK
tara:strand:+ start:3807 stop:4655 length:849 start_codon:yes stop_codon:yes gene_type:complete